MHKYHDDPENQNVAEPDMLASSNVSGTPDALIMAAGHREQEASLQEDWAGAAGSRM